MALCTQADIENLLQITFTNPTDPTVAAYIGHAEEIIRMVLGYNVEAQTNIIETFDGPTIDGTKLFLREVPLTTVNSVTEDGVVLTVDSDYKVDTRLATITRVWGADTSALRKWSIGRKDAIVVDYDAGYGTVPNPITFVCARVAARIFLEGAAFANNDNVGIVREAIGDYRVSYADPAVEKVGATPYLTPEDLATLSRFRRFVFR